MNLFSEDLGLIETDHDLARLQGMYPNYDPAYVCLSSARTCQSKKMWMEELWNVYRPYADTHFQKEFKIQFSQRSWELYLACTFLCRGYTLGSSVNAGPDFRITRASISACVEAVSVTRGDGVDQVPDMVDRVAMDIPEEQMMLRISSALNEKHDKYLAWISKGHIKNNQPYVIAINRSGLGHVDASLPLILKVLFGIGHQMWDQSARGVRGWSLRSSIEKKKGGTIDMLFFEDKTYEGISAVLYCIDSIRSSPQEPEKMGENFFIIYNPVAKNPLPEDFFSFGEVYKANGEQIVPIRRANA